MGRTDHGRSRVSQSDTGFARVVFVTPVAQSVSVLLGWPRAWGSVWLGAGWSPRGHCRAVTRQLQCLSPPAPSGCCRVTAGAESRLWLWLPFPTPVSAQGEGWAAQGLWVDVSWAVGAHGHSASLLGLSGDSHTPSPPLNEHIEHSQATAGHG